MSFEDQNLQDYFQLLKEIKGDNENQQKVQEMEGKGLLTKEQRQMYEMLGITLSSFADDNSQLINLESENEKSFEEIPQQNPEDEAILTSDEEDQDEIKTRRSSEYNNELVKSNEKQLVQAVEIPEHIEEKSNDNQVPKRPFLRRGSGLTSRFGVSPDNFNLKNLPPYKYTERVKKTLGRSSTDNKKVVPEKFEQPKIQEKPQPAPIAPQEKKSEKVSVTIEQPITETPKNNMKVPKGISWAQILSENNILTCPAVLNGEQLGDCLDDTNLFQLLENKISETCPDTSVTSLMKLLEVFQNKSKEECDDETLVQSIHPNPEEFSIDDTMSDAGVEESCDENQRVRFANAIEICDDNEEVATDLSTDLEAIELSQTSTPNERKKFDEFKLRMLGHKGRNEEELKVKSKMMKTKLSELELEIESLRNQTSQISKMRQDLEMEKMQLENDREEMMQNIDDERVRMEMQLHDEKVKLENEKKKFEKSLKTSTKKDRDEIAKLKEQIENLTEEMKLKESRHAASTARYRSQLKQVEKENQSLKLEVEVIKKENKKLEFENARLRKDTNSKMLQEINRNIAKLAPPESKTETKKPIRRSDPTISKRTKSVPALNVESSSSSDEEIPQAKSGRSSKENHPVKIRKSDPPKRKSANDILSDLKREIVNSDGSKDIWYPNGNLKKISPDGMLIRMLYFNKDIKESNINEGTVKYYYNETNTWHTTYIDGLEIIEYPDGQIEHRYKDGRVESHFTNGSIRVTNPNWNDEKKEEWQLPDGTNICIRKDDTKILTFTNGQREIHTPNNKRREYPDGTVKIAYTDGSLETRYSNGRIRIKDSKGNLVSDTMIN